MNSIILLNAFADKKTKSIGNKCLIKLTENKYLIDYNLYLFDRLYKDYELIIVGDFESKKLIKYMISNKIFDNKIPVRYIEHEPKDVWNIGKSILEAVKVARGENILIMNSSIVMDKDLLSIIKKSKSSCLFCNSTKTDGIGCCATDNKIVRCFYGLDNEIYELLYLDKVSLNILRDCIKIDNISKMYLFEIINMCINNGAEINLCSVNKKLINVIDSISIIKTIQNKYKKYDFTKI